jgi:hypothetical protein
MWSKHVYTMLMEMGVAYCVHDDCEGSLDDFKAQTLITQSCTEEYLVQISDQYSAYVMWHTLLDVFRVRAQGKLISLHNEARTLTMFPGEKPSAYILRGRKIANTIRNTLLISGNGNVKAGLPPNRWMIGNKLRNGAMKLLKNGWQHRFQAAN